MQSRVTLKFTFWSHNQVFGSVPITLIKLIGASSWNTVNVMVSVKRVLTLSGQNLKTESLQFYEH